MQQGDEQEQDAREEDRAAGEHDTQEGERCAGNQEHGPPAGPRSAGEPHHWSGAGRCILSGAAERVTDVNEHPGPFLHAGSHQALRGKLLVSCLQDNRLTMTGQDQEQCLKPNGSAGEGVKEVYLPG